MATVSDRSSKIHAFSERDTREGDTRERDTREGDTREGDTRERDTPASPSHRRGRAPWGHSGLSPAVPLRSTPVLRALPAWRAVTGATPGAPFRCGAPLRGAPRDRRLAPEVPRVLRPIGSGGNSDPGGGGRIDLSPREADWLASMRSWAVRLIGRWQVARQDIEDVVQESFAVAAIHWAEFVPRSDEPDELERRRWLARILFNAAGRWRDRLSKRERREVELTERLEESLSAPPPPDAAAERHLLATLKHGTSAERWRAWHAFEIDGVPVQEIARQEGLSVAGIYTRLLHARRDLTAALRRSAARGERPMVRPSGRRGR